MLSLIVSLKYQSRKIYHCHTCVKKNCKYGRSHTKRADPAVCIQWWWTDNGLGDAHTSVRSRQVINITGSLLNRLWFLLIEHGRTTSRHKPPRDRKKISFKKPPAGSLGFQLHSALLRGSSQYTGTLQNWAGMVETRGNEMGTQLPGLVKVQCQDFIARPARWYQD